MNYFLSQTRYRFSFLAYTIYIFCDNNKIVFGIQHIFKQSDKSTNQENNQQMN